MIVKSIILLLALGLVFPLIAADAADGDERLWDIRIQPTEDGSGKFTFDASLKQSSTSQGRSSEDELRVPTMIVVPGKESNIDIKTPDGEPAMTARVLIAENGMKVKYSVMIRTEEGVHRSSANLDLSVKKTETPTE